MAGRRGGSSRSAGTLATFADLARLNVPGWRRRREAADLAALDKGEVRTVMCWFRGLYGTYNRKWHIYVLVLTPEEPLLRKSVPFRRQVRIVITESLVSAWLRPPETLREGRRVGASGQYAPGGSLEHVGHQIVCCKTTEGILEFAVRRIDVPLLLQYITMKATKADSIGPASQDANHLAGPPAGFTVGLPRDPDESEPRHA